MDVTFYFDPLCPWTWRASRWLTQVAEARGLDIEWGALSLLMLNDGDAPEEYRAGLEASLQALRLVEALRADGRHGDAGRFYTELGNRTHEKDEPLSAEILREAAKAAGLQNEVPVLNDDSWDASVRSSLDTAMASAGPDVGSPVFTLPGAERGLHGPILAEIPSVEQSLQIWDAAVPLLRAGVFFELKRGRR
jgi:predicted DsbA family dithiol-disulfide isomerase